MKDALDRWDELYLKKWKEKDAANITENECSNCRWWRKSKKRPSVLLERLRKKYLPNTKVVEAECLNRDGEYYQKLTTSDWTCPQFNAAPDLS